MQVDVLFKIAGVGILVTVLHQLLTKSGREEMAMLVSIAGLVLALCLVIEMIGDLFTSVRSIFQLF